MQRRAYEPADIVIDFALMYHLENPIVALRPCREMTRKTLLVETHTTILDLGGRVDSGQWSDSCKMHGYFFVGNPRTIEGSASDVHIGEPPPEAYQQVPTGKRPIVAAHLWGSRNRRK